MFYTSLKTKVILHINAQFVLVLIHRVTGAQIYKITFYYRISLATIKRRFILGLPAIVDFHLAFAVVNATVRPAHGPVREGAHFVAVLRRLAVNVTRLHHRKTAQKRK